MGIINLWIKENLKGKNAEEQVFAIQERVREFNSLFDGFGWFELLQSTYKNINKIQEESLRENKHYPDTDFYEGVTYYKEVEQFIDTYYKSLLRGEPVNITFTVEKEEDQEEQPLLYDDVVKLLRSKGIKREVKTVMEWVSKGLLKPEKRGHKSKGGTTFNIKEVKRFTKEKFSIEL